MRQRERGATFLGIVIILSILGTALYAGIRLTPLRAQVLGLIADGTTVIEDVGCIATSFPRFVGTLRALGAELEVEP